MHSSSESEGEIIESEREKANTAKPVAKGASVDRNFRHGTPVSNTSKSSLDDHHASYRSRSRSPYRAKSPRGEKRRLNYDDSYHAARDGHDSRRFKVRYEEEISYGDSRRQRVSYADIDRNDSDRDRDPRTRNRSRSPFRQERGLGERGRYDKVHRNDNHEKRDRGHWKDDNRAEKQGRDRRGRLREEPAPAFVRGDDDRGTAQNVRALKGAVTRTMEQPQAPSCNEASQTTRMDVDEGPAAEPAIVDEAALIEERRKRREAIKAKFKDQSTPLLVQALQLGNQSGSATPKPETPPSRVERSVSPIVSTPATPKQDSAPESPAAFEVQNDEDLANHNQKEVSGDEAEGPSAADYDPTMDMQEDRARHDQRHNDDQAAATYDETNDEGHDILTHASPVEGTKPAKHPKSDYDMFADDDDDDMFAPEPKAKTTAVATSKTVAIAQDTTDGDLDLRDNWDDPDGYYRFNPRDAFDGRYRPQSILGRGMFSAVFRAQDIKSDKLVAIKVIRNNDTMRKAGYKEIEILQKLQAADPDDKKHLIRLISTFDHKQHLCMVFENLSMNLREVLKKFGRDVGINLKAVRIFSAQMFQALGLLKKCNILHADLKPDNILVNEARNTLKICDLGSAGDASENEITPYLVSRFYRAPEVILGARYDFAIDMWSIGCTLFELYTGKILFTGRTNNQMLKAIMECRGKFSPKMLSKAEFGLVHFDEMGQLFRSVEKDKVTGKDTVRMLNFQKPTKDLKSRVLASSKGLLDADMRELNLFIDLLDRCLQLNPERRITPNDALKHPFILRSKT